jgi:hypothetical protein
LNRELGEDQAVARFLDMCHSVSNEINNHLLRERLERRFDELAAVMKKREGSKSA